MPSTSLEALFVALLMVVLPPVLGAGLALRLPTWARWGLGIAAAYAIVVLAHGQRLPAWDAVVVGGGFALGMVVAERLPQLLGGACLFGVVAVGVGSLALPEAPTFAELHDWKLELREPLDLRGEGACGLAYPEVYDKPNASYREVGDRVWLHLGDSMLVFSDVAQRASQTEPSRFVQLLDARDEGRDHVNFGVAGTSIDVGLTAARVWRERLPLERVVVYHLPNNDLTDFTRTLPCCPSGPILDWEDPSLLPRCATPVEPLPRKGLRRWAMGSAAPLPLLVASARTKVGGQVRLALDRALRPWEADQYDDDFLTSGSPELAEAWRRFDAVLAALAMEFVEDGVPVTFVVLPSGPDLFREPHHRKKAPERAAEAMVRCEAAGLECLDAWPLFREPAPDGGWFMADGYHLNGRGHAHLADWLQQRLLAGSP